MILFGISYFLLYLLNLCYQILQINIPTFLSYDLVIVINHLHYLLRLLLINKFLQILNVLFICLHLLLKQSHISLKRLSLCIPSVGSQFGFIMHFSQFFLHFLQIP